MVEQFKKGLTGLLNSAWAPMVTLVGLAFWVGVSTSQIESRAEKQARIDRAVIPVKAEVKLLQAELSDHQRASTHNVMEERSQFILLQIQQLSKDIEQLEKKIDAVYSNYLPMPRLEENANG